MLLLFMFVFPAAAQKGWSFSFGGGPLKSLLENNNGVLRRHSNPKGRISSGEGFFIHYGFNDYIGIKAGVQLASTGIKLLQATGVRSTGLGLFYKSLLIHTRLPLPNNKCYFIQSLGLSVTGTGNQSGSVGRGTMLYDSVLTVRHSLCLQASIGIEALVYKGSSLSLELIGMFGTKVLELYSIKYSVESYYNRGSFLSFQLNYKIPFSWFGRKKKKNDFSDQSYE